jgi:ABC-2 type transport system permease protein
MTVFVREYLAVVTTKTFLMTVVLTPLLGLGAGVLVFLASQLDQPEVRRCALVDSTGKLGPALAAAALRRNAELARRGRAADPFVFSEEPVQADRRKQGLALSDRVRSGELFCFVEVDGTVLAGSGEPSVRYFTASPTYTALPAWLESELERLVHRTRLERAGVNAEVALRAEQRVTLEHVELYERAATGAAVERGRRDWRRDFVVPLALTMLTYLALLAGATPLMQSVLEEKMHRIAEILVSSVPPASLMLGKLLGASAVSFTVLAAYMAAGWLIALLFGYPLPLPLGALGWALLFECIALLMYGSLFLAVGSACSDLRQSQTLMTPVALVVVTPLMLIGMVLEEPNGPLSTGLSLFPFFTPALMLLRVTLPPGAPVWQPILGALLSAGAAFVCAWASGRIFRVALLVQGGLPRLSELGKWVLRG